MAKLKLNLDQLAVDSFNTEVPEKTSGTVFGEQCTCYTNCTCPGCPTCDNTCPNTCDASCNGSCVSCNNTCDYTCGFACGGTQYDATCNGYGTCGVYPCKHIP